MKYVLIAFVNVFLLGMLLLTTAMVGDPTFIANDWLYYSWPLLVFSMLMRMRWGDL